MWLKINKFVINAQELESMVLDEEVISPTVPFYAKLFFKSGKTLTISKNDYRMLSALLGVDALAPKKSKDKDVAQVHQFDDKLFKAQPIKVLNLFVKAERSLIQANIHTIKSLLTYTKKELLAVPGVGFYNLKNIIHALQKHNLYLENDR